MRTVHGWHIDVDGDPRYIDTDGHNAWVRPQDIHIGALSHARRDEAHAALAKAIATLAEARELAARLDQRIDADGRPVDREATVTTILDLLTGDDQ